MFIRNHKIFVCFFAVSFLLSNIVKSQLYNVNINKIRYLQDLPDGTNISPELNEIISNSSNNDVIVLPAGKFVISGQINISYKQISIIGQGTDSITGTMLYRTATPADNSYMFSFVDMSNVAYFSIITGIYFKSLRSLRYGGNNAIRCLDNGLLFNRNLNFIISDNIFQYFGVSGVQVLHYDSITSFNGLLFNNSFLDLYRPEIANYGYGVVIGAEYNSNERWISDPEFGSRKFVFIEDNVFRESRHAIAGASNAKYVFRYNKINDNWITTAVDMHGAGEHGNLFSSRAAEIYSNTIDTKYDAYGKIVTESTPKTHYVNAIGIRGGEALIYSNKVSNYISYNRFQLENNDRIGYPSPYQIGYLSGVKYGKSDSVFTGDHGSGDVFSWNPIYSKKHAVWNTHYIESSDIEYLRFNRDIDTVAKPGYIAYTYPHDYRNFYYSFIDTFLNNIKNVNLVRISGDAVRITWDDVPCEEGYYIYCSIDSNSYSIIDTINSNETNATIKGLEKETQYYFYIRAYNDDHIGSKSRTITRYETQKPDPVMIYPNPSSGLLNIKFDNTIIEILKIAIISMVGKIICEESNISAINEHIYQANIPNASSGIFLIKITTKNKTLYRSVVILK